MINTREKLNRKLKEYRLVKAYFVPITTIHAFRYLICIAYFIPITTIHAFWYIICTALTQLAD